LSNQRRSDTGQTLIYGSHPVIETIRAGRRKIYEVFLVKGSDAEKRLGSELDKIKVNVRFMSGVELNSMTPEAKNQGVAARVAPFPYSDFDTQLSVISRNQDCTVLVLDQIQDPNNLGNILRSACCFNVDLVVLSRDRAVPVTASVEKASAGAAAHMCICIVTNLNRSLESLKKSGCWVYGADASSGENLFDTKISEKAVFVMGAEGAGLRRLVKENCDILVKIPMTGPIGSLNVSNATSVILAEAFHRTTSKQTKEVLIT
jgi:23S rRNA (guanosine2251-2'-O)-methyltransferase